MTLDQLIQVFPQRFSTNHRDSNHKESAEISPKFKDSHEKSEFAYSDEDLDILREIQNYEPFVTICKETMHANQINKLITTTGQQLLCSLNL